MSEKSNSTEIRIDVNYAIELITEIFQAKSCNHYEAKTIAERTSEKKLYSVLGGGDTISLINKFRKTNNCR